LFIKSKDYSFDFTKGGLILTGKMSDLERGHDVFFKKFLTCLL